MTGSFKVGEVLVGVGFVIDVERNGMECIVLTPLEMMHTHNVKRGVDSTAARHLAEWSGCDISAIKPINLRRKQPPTGETAILRMFDLAAPAPREVEVA